MGLFRVPKQSIKGKRSHKLRLTRLPRFAPEAKIVDVNANSAANNGGAILLLNGVQPGTALNQRVGRQIQMRSLKYHLTAAVTAATGVDQIHRVLIVLDAQPNGAALAVGDVLDGGQSSQVNISNQKRFKILFDERIYLNASGEPDSARLIDGSIGINTIVQYNTGVAGTVADIATNSLYMITLGSEAAGATAGTVAGTVRCMFYDQ
jgi:hypothetical protein